MWVASCPYWILKGAEYDIKTEQWRRFKNKMFLSNPHGVKSEGDPFKLQKHFTSCLHVTLCRQCSFLNTGLMHNTQNVITGA